MEGPVTYDALKSLKYMRCVINESEYCTFTFLLVTNIAI